MEIQHICPRCGRYCIPFIDQMNSAGTWTTKWLCICGYEAKNPEVTYTTTTTQPALLVSTGNITRTINDQHSRQIQKEGGVPSLEA